jgi:orotate phosphoribosyltransferase
MTVSTAGITERLERVGALLEGHFQLTSGRHSDRYVQCAKLLCLPTEAEPACAELAAKLAPLEPDVVIGPAMGGIIVAHEVARCLGTPAYFTERKDGAMTLRRGFAVAPGQKVVIVEDVVTTGGSVKEVIALLREAGAEVVAVGSLVCRAPESPFDVPFETLLPVEVTSWEPQDCPLCAQGSEPVKPGSRPGN